MGLRQPVPVLQPQLDLDQDCYNFIKWYANEARGSCGWDDMSLPFLNVKDASFL